MAEINTNLLTPLPGSPPLHRSWVEGKQATVTLLGTVNSLLSYGGSSLPEHVQQGQIRSETHAGRFHSKGCERFIVLNRKKHKRR